jgi:glucose dehydrogenase
VDQQASLQAACRSRIFTGTNDMRVIALDVKTGRPFGFRRCWGGQTGRGYDRSSQVRIR